MSPPFALGAWLEQGRAEVEGALAEAMRSITGETPGPLREAMGYGLLGGGKRLRPILALAAHDLFAPNPGPDRTVALDFACALEMIHTYSLLHDDLPAMDDDDLRRGRPTCHKVFGEAMALLAGDGLLTGAFQLLARGDEPRRLPLIRLLATAAGADGMVGGQADDMRERWPPELSFLESLHARKTGALIAAACAGGAMAAAAPVRAIEALSRYGRHLGLAFQIADDLLDIVGDAAVMGKSTGNDLRHNKTSFPARVGLEAARDRAKAEVEAARAALGEAATSLALAALAGYAIERDH